MRHSVALLALILSCCDWSLQRMVAQNRCEPDEATPFLANGSCNQAPPEEVVPFGSEVAPDSQEHAAPGPRAETTRPALDRTALEQGREHFETICATCHGLLGDGRSPVAKHMRYRAPPSLHEAELLEKPDEFILEAISNGYGLMPSYAHMLAPQQRWQVVAYVRALQRSQNAALDELPASIRKEAEPWLR